MHLILNLASKLKTVMKIINVLFISFCLILNLNENLHAQLPNPGFENWTSVAVPSYEDPDDWSTINSGTSFLGLVTATKATAAADVHSGSAALRLETLSIPIVSQIAPGIATTGIINQTSQTIESGQPINFRPSALKGWFKYSPLSADNCDINVTLTKWNVGTGQRDTIGGGLFHETNTVSTYTEFTAPISYINNQIPDTAIVILLSSNPDAPVENSVLYVDDLSFFTAAPLMVSISAFTNVSCNGFCDGTATATATGGFPPYAYFWNGPGGSQTSITATNLCAGTYTVEVTDNDGTTANDVVTISEPAALTAQVVTIAENYPGATDGSATVTVSGGAPAYSYLWNDAAGQTTATASGLSAGTYSVTITDGNGCTADFSAVIESGCPDVTGISTTNITQSSATLNWTASAGVDHFVIRGNVLGLPPSVSLTINNGNQTSFNATGLSSGTGFYWQIRAYCDAAGNTSSNWSDVDTFTTSSCTSPAPISTTNITTEGATLNWTAAPDAHHYEIRGNVSGLPPSVSLTINNPNQSSFVVTGLPPGTDFYWQIITYCNNSETQSSSWSANDEFSTFECIEPASTSTSNITFSSATLNWTSVSGATGYEIRGGLSGGGFVSLTINNGSSTSFNATGLSPLTSYDWQIRTLCGADHSSWTALNSVTTLELLVKFDGLTVVYML